METARLSIPRWFDRHLHLRDGVDPDQLLHTVLPYTLASRATGAVCMGNLKEPVTTIARAINYRGHITSLLPEDSDFKPLTVCYLTDDTTPEEVTRGSSEEKVWCAVKLMMKGGSTGSGHGVTDLLGRYPVFEAMQKAKIPLLGHWESVDPDVDEFEREVRAMDDYLIPILKAFPGLNVVFEHVSDGRAADFVADGGYHIWATVTPHHLMFNRNTGLFKGGLNTANFCKPILKTEDDRKKLVQYVTSGDPSFGAGTDSAPHPVSSKDVAHGASAGIFSAPTALSTYIEIFEKEGKLEHLGKFLSVNFLNLYGMEVSTEMMHFEKVPNEAPKKVGNIHVFRGGEELQWKLVG